DRCQRAPLDAHAALDQQIWEGHRRLARLRRQAGEALERVLDDVVQGEWPHGHVVDVRGDDIEGTVRKRAWEALCYRRRERPKSLRVDAGARVRDDGHRRGAGRRRISARENAPDVGALVEQHDTRAAEDRNRRFLTDATTALRRYRER